jgi:hypothetical protein
METKRGKKNESSRWNLEMLCEIDNEKNAVV